MVLHAPQQQLQHAPVVRDFLGLGSLLGGAGADPVAEVKSSPEGVSISPNPGFPPPSRICVDSTGMRYLSMAEHMFPVRKNSDERYLEETAETFGFSSPKQWPGMDVSNSARLDANAKPSSTQLTIFYGGHVNVYNNVPFDRAESIMQMAANGESLSANMLAPPYRVSHASGSCHPQKVAENVHGTAHMVAPIIFAADQASQNQSLEFGIPNTPLTDTSPKPEVPKALPLARKASLARFLEKRKERMQMMSPYFKKQTAPVAPGEHMLSLLQNAGLSNPHSQYFSRPYIYCFQDQTDISSNGIPARQ